MPLYGREWTDKIPDSQELLKQNKQQARQRRGHLHMHTQGQTQRTLANGCFDQLDSSLFLGILQEPGTKAFLLGGLVNLLIYSCTVAHWIHRASADSDHFYLKRETVSLKRLTSRLHLSLSGPRYLLRDFLQLLSAGRTRSVQICTTNKRKRQGGPSTAVYRMKAALHIQLDECRG